MRSMERLRHINNAYVRDKQLLMRLDLWLKRLQPQNVLVYLPLPIEANILPLVQKWRQRYDLFAPFMEGFSFKMVKLRLPLHVRRFGIREPKNSGAQKPRIDVVVVPVIGVDEALKRVGFGKGMYDRFFQTLTHTPVIICIQRELCMTSVPISQAHDIQADIYLTPYQSIIQRGYYDRRIHFNHGSRHTQRRCRVLHRQKDGGRQL